MHTNKAITILSPSVIEKIAAGEVVERPSAVIKELVENSIDAGATRIQIKVEHAGFSLIQVGDNGCGMSPENLLKCVLPHTTSKIENTDDLYAIATFGFRGEALGSIGAVSNLSVVSASENDGCGYSINDNGGDIATQLVPQAHGKGTTITVEDLFYNVPARKKFMKTKRGEHLAIIRMLEQLVIPFPSIHFTLIMDNKVVFDLPMVDTLPERIAPIAGNDFVSRLIECHSDQEYMECSVYVSSPQVLYERPRFQSLYVNLRRINNDSVQYSVREAFSQFLGHNHRPAYFCFLSIDPSKIDVNVHPTKQLIKFDNDREIFSFVFNTVHDGITSSMVSKNDIKEDEDIFPGTDSPSVDQRSDHNQMRNIEEPVNGDLPKDQERSIKDESDYSYGKQKFSVAEMIGNGDNGIQTILPFPSRSKAEKAIDFDKDKTVQLKSDVPDSMWNLIPCYQIHSMYILAQIKNGILIIDQHAAHERILFEQAMEKRIGIRETSQQLLFPIVMELTPAEMGIIESGREYFEQFGFEVNAFSGNTVSISALPSFIKDGMVEMTIRDMIRYLLEGKNPVEFNEPHKRFAAAFACGAAIKAGQKMTQEEMNTLLNNLFAAHNPYTCPHGRPTLIRMSIDELSRRFLR